MSILALDFVFINEVVGGGVEEFTSEKFTIDEFTGEGCTVKSIRRRCSLELGQNEGQLFVRTPLVVPRESSFKKYSQKKI